jgi:hypothetical protein
VQAPADVHDTPDKTLSCAPEGLGVASKDQALPLNTSARVNSVPVPSRYAPTAVQALVEVQETLFNTLPSAPGGPGEALIDHDLPLSFSTKVVTLFELSSEPPTAMHLVAEVHDTPERLLAVAPDGLGVVSIDQEAPFHTSARLTWTPVLSRYVPTAAQAVAEVQDTPSNSLP